MRIAFLGYGEIGLTVLRDLPDKHEVAVVVTHPSGYTGLEDNRIPEFAAEYGIPVVLGRTAGEPQILAALREVAPEVLVSANWRTTVPVTALEVPSRYPVNVHDALLPSYAGFGSVNWAIRNGETEIGLTVHVMEQELDTGPVINQVVVPIGPNETAGEVLERLLAVYSGAVLQALDLLAAGAEPMPQPKMGSTFYHRIELEDTQIDWTLSSRQLVNLVRGQSDPFLNAWFLINKERVFVKRALAPRRSYRGTPGRVVKFAEGGVAVACGSSWEPDSDGLILLEVQPEGGPRQPATNYFKKPGTRLR